MHQKYLLGVLSSVQTGLFQFLICHVSDQRHLWYEKVYRCKHCDHLAQVLISYLLEWRPTDEKHIQRQRGLWPWMNKSSQRAENTQRIIPPFNSGFSKESAHFCCMWPIFPNSSVKLQSAAASSDFPCFVKDWFQKVVPAAHANPHRTFLGAFLSAHLHDCSIFKKREKSSANSIANREHSCMFFSPATGLKQQQCVYLWELPLKNWAQSPRSWQWEGRPWMKKRAGIMVNHRVKPAAPGWGSAAWHHRERKGSTATT